MIDLLLRLIDRLIELAKRKEEIDRIAFSNFLQPAFQAFEAVHTDYIESLIRYRTRFDDLATRMDLDHPVFADLQLDALKSEHLRTKLLGFTIDTSPKKLRPLLFEIDGYLRGLVGSTAGLDLVNKVTFAPNEVTKDFLKQRVYSELEWLSTFRAYQEPDPDSPFPPLTPPRSLFDPIRRNLQNYFEVVDTPTLAEAEVVHLQWEVLRLNDTERRRRCREAIDMTIEYFQNAFAVISARYSKLRAELLALG